ncbi:MAG TPA: hypothetical protein VN282_11220 [Pyrinomonadaceae bacterium]|nr:hypothetical protein [Pyrinomonadaceae bacterium]
MAPHIPLSQRKALCGRLSYYDAFQSHELELYADSAAAEVESFCQQFFAQLDLESRKDAQQRVKESDSSETRQPLTHLDVSLRSVLDRFKQILPAVLLEPQSVVTQRLLPAIENTVAGISCQGCTPFGRVCEGVSDAEDDEIVSAAGLCVRQLRQMFDLALEVAHSYYVTHGSLFPRENPPEVVFSTLQFESEVDSHNAAANRYGGGLTIYFPIVARAQVQLHLYIQKFDLETYKSVLYLLFHECIAHAFHGIHPDPKKRVKTEPYERYAEGWMDWVAYKILEEVVKGTGPEGQRWQDRITLPDVFAVSTTLHRARSNPTNRGDGVRQIRLGARAAELTCEFFHELLEEKSLENFDDPWGNFLQLSFDLNALGEIDAKKRNAFVGMMRHLEFSPKEDEIRYPLDSLLIDYLRTRDIHTLIEEVYKLDHAS